MRVWSPPGHCAAAGASANRPGSTASRCSGPRAAIGFALAARSNTRSSDRVRTILVPEGRGRVPWNAVGAGKRPLRLPAAGGTSAGTCSVSARCLPRPDWHMAIAVGGHGWRAVTDTSGPVHTVSARSFLQVRKAVICARTDIGKSPWTAAAKWTPGGCGSSASRGLHQGRGAVWP